MDRVLNMQLSLFGAFIDIKLKTEVVIQLLSALKDENYVPGSAEVASVDFRTGKLMVDSRIQMLSPDKTWTIVFLPERIDFNYTFQPETKIYKQVDGLLPYAKQIIEKVFSVFSATTGNRLAINCRLALENMTSDDLQQFCNRFTKPMAAYKDETYAEWSVRFNSHSMFKISQNQEEECNRITEMVQAEKQNLGWDNDAHKIVLTVDVNTLPINSTNRFKYDNLIYFANDATRFISQVTKEVEGEN